MHISAGRKAKVRTKMTELERDKLARERIKNETDKNFFVQAGAGSGKTYSLVERMLSMVLSGKEVEKICALTFTKAAANEFYIRFYERLNEVLNDREHGKEEKEAAARALQNIDLCFMGTMDSYCQKILSEHPAEAGIPANTALKSEEEMTVIFLREYNRIAHGKYGPELKKKQECFASLTYRASDIFRSLAMTILKTRNAEHIYEDADYSLDEIDQLSRNEKGTILAFIRELDNHEEYICRNTDRDPDKFKNSFRTGVLDKKYLLEADWTRDISGVIKVLNSLSGIRVRKDSNELFLTDFSDKLVSYKDKYYTYNTDEIIGGLKKATYPVFMDFTVNAVKRIAEELRKEGNFIYFDYVYYLRQMLEKDASSGGKLIRHIYKRHAYYLLDEFQDTNPIVSEIIFYLTAENPQKNWRDCKPRPGSLFIVGDPKQSIYRFSYADVTAYMRIKELFNEDEVIELSKNFRSSKTMCDYFNEVFPTLLPEDTEIQSKFTPIPAEENTDRGSLQGAYILELPSISQDEEEIVKLIKNLSYNPAFTVYDSDTKETRQIRYSDIMVITPAKTHISDFLRCFNENNIPAKVEGKVSLSESAALNDMSRIFAAVANPTDELKVSAALMTRTVGISEEELNEFTAKGGSLNVYSETDADGCTEIKSALGTLSNIVKESRGLSPIAVLNLIEKEYHVFSKNGAYGLEYYLFADEKLRSSESNNEVLSLKAASEYLVNLALNNTKEERCLSVLKDENKVHIANLHKVKGLEAPVVILADGRKKPNMTIKIRMSDIQNGKECRIIQIDGTDYGLFDDEVQKEKDCLTAERDRLLYVAATRAAQCLVISDHRTGKDGPAASYWRNLLDRKNLDRINELEGYMNERDGGHSPACLADDLYDEASVTVFDESSSYDAGYRIDRPSGYKVKSKTSPEDEFDEESRIKTEDLNPALRGTLVHKLMEVLVSSKGDINVSDSVSEIVSDYAVPAEMISDCKKMLTGVADSMKNGGYAQTNDMPQDLLSELSDAEEIHCELPFCRRTESEEGFVLEHGVMDLAYMKNGAWHIVDYKSNKEIEGLDEEYEKQLSAYMEAFRSLTGENADAFIYHIDV